MKFTTTITIEADSVDDLAAQLKDVNLANQLWDKPATKLLYSTIESVLDIYTLAMHGRCIRASGTQQSLRAGSMK